jgi:hypothetical protein
MARQHIAVEFLPISLVYGADNWFLKIEEQVLYESISYCLFDGGMTVRDSDNRVSTTSGSQRVWTRLLSRLWNRMMNQLPNSFYTVSLDEVIERLYNAAADRQLPSVTMLELVGAIKRWYNICKITGK